MTCQELHAHFEDPLLVDAELRTDRLEVAQHLVHCTSCRCFVQAQREIGADLRILRDSAPKISASLDAAVLADYRRCIPKLASPSYTSVRSLPVTVRHWIAAVAAVVLLTVISLLLNRRTVTTAAQPQTTPVTATHQLPATSLKARGVTHRTKRAKPDLVVARRKERASSVVSLKTPLPAGFSSLMYCDELSCAGAMEMIRVELPRSDVGTVASATQTNGVVFADLLVGPDGIARGIRIVE